MPARRSLTRFWRRLRRPSFGRLVGASLVLHLGAAVLALWLAGQRPVAPRPTPSPLIVELPPAAPGPPLVRPEVPAPRGRGVPSPPAVAARPTPPSPPPRATPARPAEPEPAPLSPAPPPAVRPSEPASPAVATPPAGPEPPTPSATAAAPAVSAPPPLPAPQAAEPVPPLEPSPSVAARSPEAGQAAAPPPSSPAESPLAGRSFSLLGPRPDAPPPLPGSAASGTGGTRRDGTGAGESGVERDGQVSVPLNTPDPRYAEYFLEIKKRIEAHLVYPQEAARQRQSGQLVLEFVVRKDGSLRLVGLTQSSGIGVLDRYSLNTVRLAAPFPPIPDRMAVDSILISANFTYILDHGFRIRGLR